MRDPAELISAYFDDCLAPGELAELRLWLMEEPGRLRQFVRESVIHSRMRDVLVQHDMRGLVLQEFFGDTIDPRRIGSLLDEEEEAEAARQAREEAERQRRQTLASARLDEQLDRKLMRIEEPRTPRALVYASFAAAAVLLVMLGRVMAPPSTPHGNAAVAERQSPPAGPPVIAEVVKTLEADLQHENQPVHTGAKLLAGSLVVKQGVAEVTFTAGAKVVVEGPAELMLITAQHAKLVRGRVVAFVPQDALGFTIHSDTASFIDLGTEFGVEVGATGLTSVQVFDGEVALVSDKKNDAPSRTLQRRAANEIAADGSVREIKYDQSRFLRRVPATAYELAVLRSRPLAYWRLDALKANVLMASEGQVAASTMPNANIALADNGRSGRPGTGPLRAALFTGDHDGIDIAGGPELGLVSNCSCEAWVLPTAAATGPQRIFSTFDRPRAGWAIGVVDGRWYKLPEDDLKFHLTIYGVYDCVSTTPIAANEWVHLAATIDDAGTPALYVNGARMERRFRPPNTIGGESATETPAAAWSADSPTPVGKATAGVARIGRNPVGSDSAISPERWQGQISNVAVYDRVLTEQEIHDHFEATRKRKTEGRARGT